MDVHELLSDLRLPVEGRLPGFSGATGWLNSDPLPPAALEGKVVAVDFWTYTCINWLRTLPYIRGLGGHVQPTAGSCVVGVHTPEFGVEHDIDNVRRAARDMGIEYPIAIDNDYAVWDAFANQYWPALYIADAEGRIRHHHFGEGGYEASERAIRQLLTDTGAADLPDKTPRPSIREASSVPADWHERAVRRDVRRAGARSEGFASPGLAALDEPHVVHGAATTAASTSGRSRATGRWDRKTATSNDANARITYRFHARDLHLILAPAGREGAGTVPGHARRTRTRRRRTASTSTRDGNGVVTDARLYQLIRQDGDITDRRVRDRVPRSRRCRAVLHFRVAGGATAR